MDVALKNPAELSARLDLASGDRLLLVDPPEALETLARSVREGRGETDVAEGRKIRAVKQSYDTILLWREDRVGSQAVFETLVKRLERAGVLWTVVALKKVQGVATPAAHRLELSDLVKAYSPTGLKYDREVRVTPWHVAYRFVRS
ncbi:MAG: hypothetical protein M3167_06965 [Acidobacteriota bacterium]|nr:hypothetical protein [Acidobacteriota bacterium]